MSTNLLPFTKIHQLLIKKIEFYKENRQENLQIGGGGGGGGGYLVEFSTYLPWIVLDCKLIITFFQLLMVTYPVKYFIFVDQTEFGQM